MKKQVLILLSFALVALSATAQKPDSAQALVHYKYTWIRDTTKGVAPYTENMILFIGQNASAYKSYDRKLQNELMRKQIAEQMAANGGSGPISIKSGKNAGTGTEYYQFPNENKLVRKESMINTYLIEEPMPVINWKISSDTSTISNLHCQKATAHFKGRDYTAWFCPDLPYRAGPWKLSGLPGLIVSAHDAKNEVVFNFNGIEQVTKNTLVSKEAPAPAPPAGVKVFTFGMDDSAQDPNIIALPDKGIKTTQKEFEHLQEAMKKDPSAFAQSAMAGAGMNNAPGRHDTMKIVVGAGPTINNPVELPEKQ